MISLESRLSRRAVQITQQLVQTRSINPPGDVRACVEIVQGAFRDAGIGAETVEADPGRVNVIARLGDPNSGPTILLNGHLDVVPATADWEEDAFSGRIADGMLIGRGAVDMKSGLAAMIAVMEEMRELKLPRRGQVLFTAVADEESGSQFGTRLLLERALRATWAIVGEPTNLEICNGNRGSLWATVTFRGKASHAARPFLGINAISAAAEFIRRVDAFKPERVDPRFEVSTPSLTVTMIQGGVKNNIVPDQAFVTLDRRMIPGESSELAELELRQLLDGSAQPGINTEIQIKKNYEPYIIAEDALPVTAMVQACQRVLRKTPRITAKAGATDASHLWHLGGIPTVIFGPGDPRLAHSSREAVPVEQIAACAYVYLEVIKLLTEPS